ncbi:MAG TPA: response regulator transcription factor [Exilispira sp.]|nr:response regulator transcription factor [bacterium]HQJ40777.1 response regulator transcription factor [Exilispira sp.]
MIKVIIVDDHPIIREGIKQITAKTNDIIVIDEASNRTELKKILREKKFDVILLDISLPGQNGIEILKEIKENFPDFKVLILSIHTEMEYIRRCFMLGASGYLTKESAPDELVQAIRKVFNGGKYINYSIADSLSSYFQYETQNLLHEKLSSREYEVFLKIAQGKSIKDISSELYLSEKTISTYRSRILEKINLKNNAEIIYYAIRHKLINVE